VFPTACSCNVFGSEREDCEQTTGQCVCKHHVTGRKCDRCTNGRRIGPRGCTGTLHEIGCRIRRIYLRILLPCSWIEKKTDANKSNTVVEKKTGRIQIEKNTQNTL